jgi:hypothetical protein
MRYYYIKIFGILLSILVLWGCPSIPLKGEKEIARKPEIVFLIASLNLSNFNKRVEQKHILDLAKVLKREQVEVLAVQGISRYPGVATRLDFVSELSAQTDWRNAFGEMMNISGHQTGNAVFSSYPILSQYNQAFDHLKTASFEAALQATIDAGLHSLVIVSMRMPLRATAEEEAQCIRRIAASNPDGSNQTTVITGNLPSTEAVRTSNSFTEVPQSGSDRGTTPRVWYSANTTFQLLASRTVETELGRLIIAQLGLFRQK